MECPNPMLPRALMVEQLSGIDLEESSPMRIIPTLNLSARVPMGVNNRSEPRPSDAEKDPPPDENDFQTRPWSPDNMRCSSSFS